MWQSGLLLEEDSPYVDLHQYSPFSLLVFIYLDLQAVLERLSLSAVMANEFIHNGVIDARSFRILTTEDLNYLIKQYI